MARTNNNENGSRGKPKTPPTTCDTYLATLSGLGLITDITKEQLTARLQEMIKENPEFLQKISIVQYTQSVQYQQRMEGIKAENTRLEGRRAKLAQDRADFDKLIAGKTPKQLEKEGLDKKTRDKKLSDFKKEEAAIGKAQVINNQTESNAVYAEDVNRREVERKNKAATKEGEKWVNELLTAEDEKKKAEEQEKQRKFNMAGMVAGQLPDIGNAFLKGKGFR